MCDVVRGGCSSSGRGHSGRGHSGCGYDEGDQEKLDTDPGYLQKSKLNRFRAKPYKQHDIYHGDPPCPDVPRPRYDVYRPFQMSPGPV